MFFVAVQLVEHCFVTKQCSTKLLCRLYIDFQSIEESRIGLRLLGKVYWNAVVTLATATFSVRNRLHGTFDSVSKKFCKVVNL